VPWTFQLFGNMIVIVLTLIAGILIVLGVSLINELKSINANLSRQCAQNELSVACSRTSLDILRNNYTINKEMSDLQKNRMMEELTILAKKVPAAVNDQITDSVTQKPNLQKRNPKKPNSIKPKK